ncbi:glycosyltransferase [Pseudoalteromonas phenolica]|uniref:Glycosyltransferase n=1 Tax=Pseudoalteromonas phenolica TaxID=161398 RepID=A0A0S2K1X8_9GAMM|nr:glycosyltransferase [Pseudoalteromonas phenolica]ALO42136.1 Glycosyltransferase [Pseudoalteromonas phenolica]MBE0356769.1 hypothetical protein [Pseudoalteromonas phenolica O-BC30]
MKHVAIMVPSFPVPSETFVITEIRALQRAGHEVSVITFEQISNDIPLPCNVFVLNKPNTFKTLLDFSQLPLKSIMNGVKAASRQYAISTSSLLFYSMKAAQIIREQNIGHLHCHFMHNSLAYGVVAAKLANIKVSSIGHGHDIYVNSADLSSKVNECDFCIAVCEDMLKLLHKFSPTKAKLLHCGVDTELFKPEESPTNSKLKLLFVGRLVEKKGLSYAISALNNLPEESRPRLEIVGDGPLRAALEFQVNELNLQDFIEFKGSKKPEQIREMARNYDGFLAPFCIADNGDKDTGPVVLKEAMAMSLPVITCDVMGCTEIVDESVGYIVESRNSQALTNAIKEYVQLNEDQRIKMRSAARQRVLDKFDAFKQGKQLSEWIQQA